MKQRMAYARNSRSTATLTYHSARKGASVAIGNRDVGPRIQSIHRGVPSNNVREMDLGAHLVTLVSPFKMGMAQAATLQIVDGPRQRLC